MGKGLGKERDARASRSQEEVLVEVGNMPTFVECCPRVGKGRQETKWTVRKVSLFSHSRSSLAGCEGGALLTVTLSPETSRFYI